MLGLSVPASAAFDAEDSQNIDHINTNVWALASALVSGVANFTWDQSNNAQLAPAQYFAYALHALKGTFKNSGKLVSLTPDNGSGPGSVYSGSNDYFSSLWVGSRSDITSTDANRWRIQTLSDNHSGSWMYQIAHSVAQSGLTMEALMNWSNPDGGTLFVPSQSAKFSWFYQMLRAVDRSKADVSTLATEATSKLIQQTMLTNQSNDATYFGRIITELASESTLSSLVSRWDRNIANPNMDFLSLNVPTYLGYQPTNNNGRTNTRSCDSTTSPVAALNDNLLALYGLLAPYNNSSGKKVGFGYSVQKFSLDSIFSPSRIDENLSFPQAVSFALNYSNYGLSAINGNLLKLDEILATENDRALEQATDDTKVTVKDYVSGKKSNYGDSFTVGSTVTDGLKPDLTTSQASSAVSGLFSPDSGDYWGWFSSETDSDLHPAASGVSTLSLDDEPSSQDVADSETVWVIDPYASSSDLISDFFGGE